MTNILRSNLIKLTDLFLRNLFATFNLLASVKLNFDVRVKSRVYR